SNGLAKANAIVDLAKRELRSGRLQYEGGLPPGLLPAGYRAETLSFTTEFAGSLTNLHHRTELQTRGFRSPQFQPLNADIAVNGQGRSFQAKGSLQAGGSALGFGFSATLNPGTNELRVQELALKTGGQQILGLQEPAS